MAVSKRARKAQERKAPDAAAFVRLIDEGLAEPEHVSAAYQQALRESMAGKTYAEILQACMADGGIVQKRSDIDFNQTPTPEARLIALHRHHTFKGTDAQPNNPQEEA